jgi:hypothetical protein
MFLAPARRSSRRATALAALLAVLVVVPAWSADPPVAESSTPAATPAAPAPPAVNPPAAPAIQPTPLVAELLKAAEAERERILELRRTIAATRDPARRLELQRQIESVKRATELQLLTIQVVHARRDGRAAVVRELEGAIAAFHRRAEASDAAARPKTDSVPR